MLLLQIRSGVLRFAMPDIFATVTLRSLAVALLRRGANRIAPSKMAVAAPSLKKGLMRGKPRCKIDAFVYCNMLH